MPDWNNPLGNQSAAAQHSENGVQSQPPKQEDWKNPFASSAPGGKKNQPPEPTPSQLVIDPVELRANWNYKTAVTGMFGESLPQGADRWTPHGTPYFGKGISGKLKEYWWMFTKDTSGPTGAEWDALKEKWKQSFDVEANVSQVEGQKMQAGLALESVKMAWQAGTSSDNSIVSPVLRGLGVALKGIGDLFSIPAVAVEKVQGAAAGVTQTAKDLGIELPEFAPEVDNWFTRYVNEQSSIVVGYAALKTIFSPRKDKWDIFSKNVKEGWDAGRIYYSGVYDKTIKEEYLRRYRAGEDAELLAMELENPVAEFAGQFVLDPLNVLGAISHAKTVDRVLDASESAVKASGTLADARAVEVIDEFGKIGKGDDLKAAELVDEFVDIHMQGVGGVTERKLTQEYKFSSLAAVSNQKVVTREAQNFIGIMQATARSAGRSFDEVAEFIKAGVMSVSKNREEATRGVTALMHFDSPKLMFSESAIKTFTLVRRMMQNEEGIVDTAKLLNLTKIENTQEFMNKAVQLITAGAKTSFPTVDEMAEAYKVYQEAVEIGGRVSENTARMAKQFERLDKRVLAANFLNAKAQKVYSPLNRVLGTFYFSLQGGVAVKNIIANNIQILVDQGPKAYFREMEFERTLADGTKEIVRRPAFWSAKKIQADLEKMLGYKTSLAAGFETQTEAAKAKGIFSKLMSAGEEGAASRVVWSSVKDSMRKLMNERYLGSVEPLRGAGMSDGQVNHLFRLLYDNAGDVEKTKQEFRALYGNGSIDSWRTLDFLPQHYEDGFHELDIYDEIADFAKNGGKSKAQVEDFFAKLSREVQSRGAAAAQDGGRITAETPGFESFQKLEEALADGDLTGHAANEILRTWLVASNEAKHQYMETLQDAVDWANRNLPQSQAIQFSERMKQLRNSEYLGKTQSEQKAMEIIDSARAWSQEIRNQKNPTSEWLRAKWKEIGLDNEPNLDLTKEGLQMVLWKYFRDKKGAVWQDYYGTIFQESRSIVEDLGKVKDITPLKAKLTQAEMAVERANQLRSAVYRKGTFYTQPGKRDIYSLAAQFGVPTAAESGRPNDKMLLNIINKYNGDPNFKLPKVGDIAEEVSVANDMERGYNPMTLIREQGGLNPMEFSDIFGGKLGRDKKGVLPGMFAKEGKGIGIDDVGRLLEDYGFINPGQAEDANYIREFLRAWADKDPKLAPKKSYIRYYSEDDIQALEAGQKDLAYYDDAGNLVMPKRPNQQFTKVQDVPGDVALEAFTNWKAAKGEQMPDPNLLQNALIPAYPSGSMPSVARAWNENTRPALYALDKTKNMILERFGQKIDGKLDANIEKALGKYIGDASSKIAEGKAISLKAAEHWRDFILHNYGAKTYGDLAMSYVMPYQFWYSRTYKNWMKRIVSDPHIVAGYAKYKDLVSKLNADKSDFYKGQLEIDGIFGIDFKHPLVFNLEAALNPLNGITGVDFTDKERRVNWWSASLDDMNKMGPTMFAPLQWGVATALSLTGEDEAARRWASRAIPETLPLKSGLNWLEQKTGVFSALSDKLGIEGSNIIPGLKYGELDPLVNIFSGGLDAYERSRVGNALGLMVQEGTITQEQAIDAGKEQSGEIWDTAVQRSLAMRAGTNLAAWGLGVGFKPRTESDQQIDSMFTELNILRTLNKDNRLTPEQYRQSLDAMREKYKFMDAVILSRRGGELRDSIYAYNVLGRLPPGVSRDTLMSVGLTDEDISKFYDSKGFTDKSVSFSSNEKERFMLAVSDLGAMLELPDYATRSEWNAAKTSYKEMTGAVADLLGEDIWDKVSAYYDLRDVSPDAATQFKNAHPEIVRALQLKQESVVNDPLLFEYYGSIDKLEAYFDGKVRQVLVDKYGDLSAIQTEYFDTKLYDPGKAKMLLRQHPELIAYWKEKNQLEEQSNRAFVEFASKLPDREPLELRSDFTPQSGQQEQLFNALQPQNAPSWGEVKSVVGKDMSPAMETILNAYWAQGTPLSTPAQKQLNYLTSRYGEKLGVSPTDPDSFLNMLGIAINKQQAQPQTQFSAQPGGWSNPFAP